MAARGSAGHPFWQKNVQGIKNSYPKLLPEDRRVSVTEQMLPLCEGYFFEGKEEKVAVPRYGEAFLCSCQRNRQAEWRD